MPPIQIEHTYECNECSLSVNSLIQLQQHFTGRKHKAKMPTEPRKILPKSTNLTPSSKAIGTSHPFGHQNVLNKKHNQSKVHILATAAPQYNSKSKVIKKYPNQGISVSNEVSNSEIHSSFTSSQTEISRSVYLQSAYGLKNQQENSYSYKDPTDSKENIITNMIEGEVSIKQGTLNHGLKVKHTNSSHNNTQKSNNFSIENILQTGNNPFNNNNTSNCMQDQSSELDHLYAGYPSNIKLVSLPRKIPNSDIDGKRKLRLSTSDDKNPKPIIYVRKDLMSPVHSNQVDKNNCNIQPVSNIGKFDIQTILQPVDKSILTPSISSQNVSYVQRSNTNALSKTNTIPPFIRTPLDSINNINNKINMQNISNISSSSNTTSQMKKKDEMSLRCYTCNKDVFDSSGNSKSLIYDHLIFGRAGCKICSKTVSCSGFTKMKNSASNCCKAEQLVYKHNPVHFLIGELDNCEKNPCFVLAEYMMKIKVLWIYMPWCQAVVDVKKFVKNPYKIPSFIFKGWDESSSPIQKTSLNKLKEDNHMRMEKMKNKEIRKVNSMNKENDYQSMKRSLMDIDNEHTESHISPPAKKIKNALRTFRIKQEFIDNCESQVKESQKNSHIPIIDLTEPMNDKTDVKKLMTYREIDSQHKQNEEEQNIPLNFNWKNESKSKLDTNPTDTFAPIIVDVCSVKNLENTSELDNAQISNKKEIYKDIINNIGYSSQYAETLNIDNDLELSCGSTIMTPDASPMSSPVDSTKLAKDNLSSKNDLSSIYTELTSLKGKMCVSKYIQDVARINSKSMVSKKTIEECPMCYLNLSLLKVTVNTENMVLKFECSCELQIHILPNINGKVLWPFNDYDDKKSERFLKIKKKGANKRKLKF